MQRDQQAWLVRFGELRHRAFSGVPVVDVVPAQWGLDPTAVRQAAHSRRYREIAPAQPESLRFEFAPGLFAPPFDHGPGTDADRRRLAKLLDGEDQFWAGSRRLRLGRDDIGKAAAAAGMTVVAEVADSTDRLLLLRRTGLPDEELRPRTAKRGLNLGLIQGLALVVCLAGTATGAWFATTTERTWPVLLIPVFLIAAVAAPFLIRAVAGRSPRVPWLDEPFDGSPQVLVSPPPSLSVELLGEVASLHGYFYAGQYGYGSGRDMLFRKTRRGLVFGTPAPSAAPSYRVPAGAPGREQWLRNHLEGRDELWVSVRHAQLSPARVAEIAHDEGLLPAADFVDGTDRILLLRRGSPVRAAKMRMSQAGYLAALAWAVVCLGGGIFTAALNGEERLAQIGLALTVVGAPPLLWVLRAFPRSARVGWLAQEFDGSVSVSFFSGQFGVSPELTRQIAAFHGYAFRGYAATTAQGLRLTYARFR
ncbi:MULTISPECIES: hypothetical protein [unclassified Amycolatopsis]|uniref:hypothetical protein n=1 Tax=unclassified Amycolatopsis TaxID=2618356 RepID=UPI00287578D2|nr:MULTISPECIES: hypothetical protein [unclassified Amycolatopsis]MDS0133372.1 hypothetical protein [Amycolatopsis sp. 505]MDS0146602.1 hypothetical protein [Amycolatopsis sp. CM201R]